MLEPSPYLLQHSNNPVNWYPWGDEAFDTARRLGRPVLVSIGYSTCHWCHVMEEESFDDVETAKLLNQHFVAIKVDREARPDVDAVYMAAVHALGQSGGWPLNVWMTPDRAPFYGGTYFPPEDSRGRPGFRRVLRSIHDSYTDQPDAVAVRAQRLAAVVAETLAADAAESSRTPSAAVLASSIQEYERRYDPDWGGLRGRVKFPASLPLRNLLGIHRRTREASVREMAVRTLEGMAAGGMHDHLGGGFHRYSTDIQWLVPHFEKMLYDNARLAVAYLEGWQATGREDFAAVVRSTLDALLRDFASPDGGLYSATDADSATPDGELEEGRFFTWTPAEIEAALGSEDAKLATAWFGITPVGQLEGRSVLHTFESRASVARRLGLAEAALGERLTSIRARLLAARAERSAPHRDDKILAAWNGLAISALSRAGFALREERYLEAAQRAGLRLLATRDAEGRLRRVRLGDAVSGPAFLEDYAFVIAGLIDLYEADSNPLWLREALALQAVLDRDHGDPTGGGYFRTSAEGERLLVREKPVSDGALPSGNGVAAQNLLRLAALTGTGAYRERALLLFSAFHDKMVETSTRTASLLLALDFELDDSLEVIVILPAEGGDAEPLLARLRRAHRPNRVVAIVREGADLEAQSDLVPLLRGKRTRRGAPTAYVCENRTCRFPTSEPDEFQAQLDRVKPLDAKDGAAR